MNTNLTPFVVIWAFLGATTLGLALYRKLLSLREDDYIHVADSQTKLVSEQFTLARKMDAIDKWGKSITVLTLVAGLAIAGAYLYQGYLESLKPVMGN
jgi:hypothetical protein